MKTIALEVIVSREAEDTGEKPAAIKGLPAASGEVEGRGRSVPIVCWRCGAINFVDESDVKNPDFHFVCWNCQNTGIVH